MSSETRPRRVTTDVGGRDLPTGASFKVSGRVVVDAELPRGADVVVTISDQDGVIIAAGHGYVQSVAFKEHRPTQGADWLERIHGVKLV